MGTTVERRQPRRNLPLEALQLLAELGVGLDDTVALKRVMDSLQQGLPKCCIAFALIYGRAVDAGRRDLLVGYRTWMNRCGGGQLGYVPCPRCLVERSYVPLISAAYAAEDR
jgi:hypothetical protein